jgi:hypothetical protein
MATTGAASVSCSGVCGASSTVESQGGLSHLLRPESEQKTERAKAIWQHDVLRFRSNNLSPAILTFRILAEATHRALCDQLCLLKE